ncbi:DUF1217 domain-containing protein [Falsiroseomonas sp. HW251]|uniref:DUF1217 domain-containing protein n=1 Tax=Falsiroseomonas sp. HW251 TaxID=3390998 RepID=UPI003D31AAB1
MLDGLGASAAMAVVDRQGQVLRDRFAARRDVGADMAAFRQRASKITDADALLKDRRTLQVVLEAFQLESEIDKRGILRRALSEDPAGQDALVNRLTDRRWRQFAADFAARQGQPPLADAALVERIVQNATTNRYEKAMGASNPGMREALYFRRMASQVTTVPQLMADSALTEVLRGALGLPTQFGLLDFDQQRDLLNRRLDVSQLKDPKAVSRMTARYLALRENAARPATGAAALFEASGDASSIAALAAKRISFSA